MDEKSLAPREPYVLYRVLPGVAAGGAEEPVSEHADFQEAWQAGTHVVTVDDTRHAYSLYHRGRRVARFGHGRLKPSRDALVAGWLSADLVGAL